MATAQRTDLLRFLHRISRPEGDRFLNDGELLRRFLESGEQSSFELLLQRHGPMVLGVCRRILGEHHDAEDAFQAVFLVVVRKIDILLDRETIGGWLYGVAVNRARKARALAVLRKRKESLAPIPSSVEHAEPDVWSEVRPVLDRELNRLPERYRDAVIQCDLLGHSRREAAIELGIPEGTLSSRLATARQKLAKRLERLRITVSSGVLAACLIRNSATASVPPRLIASTVASARAVATRTASPSVSHAAATLSDGVIRSMFLTGFKMKLLALFGLVLVSSGVASLFGQRLDPEARPENPAASAPTGDPRTADDAKETSASGTFVSFKAGTLTIRSGAGVVAYGSVGANYRTYQDNEAGAGSKLVETAKALGALKPGAVIQVDVEKREIQFGLDFRVIGTLESYRDGTLTLVAADAPAGFVKRPEGTIAIKLDPKIPALESVDGGDFKFAGAADAVLRSAKKGALITARSEYDPIRMEVVQIGSPKRRMERYVGQSRATIRGSFLSWKGDILRVRGKGLNPLAANEYERVVASRIPAGVPIVESIDGGAYKPTTADALNDLKEGSVVTIRKVEEVVLEVQIGLVKPK